VPLVVLGRVTFAPTCGEPACATFMPGGVSGTRNRSFRAPRPRPSLFHSPGH